MHLLLEALVTKVNFKDFVYKLTILTKNILVKLKMHESMCSRGSEQCNNIKNIPYQCCYSTSSPVLHTVASVS